MNPIKVSLLLLFSALTAEAQLVVTLSPLKCTGQKAVLQLCMTNYLAASVVSARAVCFLLDGQGKMIGQSSKWVIGGIKDRPALQPKTGSTFNFVITSPQPFVTTNLTAMMSFSRIVLSGQKLANPQTDIKVQNRN